MRVPEIRKNAPAEIQIPGVVLPPGININIQRLPDGTVHAMVGPMILVLPLSQESAKSVGDALKAASSGVIVADGLVGL